MIKTQKISYDTGGFFNIRNVRWSENGEMFCDYQFLIDTVEDPSKLELLRKYNQTQQNVNKDETDSNYILREDIMESLNGVGRII